MKRSFIDKLIYKITEKPQHYVEVKDPPKTVCQKILRPQAARQVQYNEWSKHFKVYSGSYLPKEEKKLLQKGKGWEDKTRAVTKNATSKTPTFYRRRRTGQWVRNDRDARPWHWYNCWGKQLDTQRFRKTNFSDAYYDKYGNVCGETDDAHHIEGKE